MNSAAGGTFPLNSKLSTLNFLTKQKDSHPQKDESLVFPPYFVWPSLAQTFTGMLVPLRCNGRLPCGILA